MGMNAKEATVKLVVVVDDDGQSAVGRDLDEAKANFADQVGALEDTEGFRVLNVELCVPLPIPVTVAAVAAEVAEGIPVSIVDETNDRR